jgi:hypothetical protein
VQARQNVFAAPFDAMAYSGMQVNGGMEVSQENSTAVVQVSNTLKYVVDGWLLLSLGTQNVLGQQTVAPSALAGFLNALSVFASPTPSPSPAAGDAICLLQSIEGFRTGKLNYGTVNAQPITIGFWVAATRTGMFSGSVRNGAINRSYVFTFTINAVNTWEFKTVTIPGDTTGTWAKDKTAGITIAFTAMSGTTLATAPGAWTAGNFVAATGTTNSMVTTSDWFGLAGVVVLPGIEAPSAARSPLIMRPYDQELMTCKRYWSFGALLVNGYGVTNYGVQVDFPTAMRASPLMSGVNNGGTNVGAALNYQSVTPQGVEIYHSVTALGAVFINDTWKADARL